MANYVPVGPWTDNAAPGIDHNFLNALEAVLKQPSGTGSESGKYFLTYNAYTINAFGSVYIQTISRTSVPVSVSFDTTAQAPTGGAGTPSSAQLSSGGFQIVSQATGANTNCRCGGNWTVNW